MSREESKVRQLKVVTFAMKEHKKSEMGVKFRRRRSSSSSRKRREVMKDDLSVCSGTSEDDEKAEVERKIVALQRIVPRGESLGVDKLFEETASYILALQSQIKAMRAFATFLEASEMEKMKFGG